ncbi:MAG: site-2 protease family protein [Rhodothermales bacterium]|nr:site-2 protease family protein [Rhodothermales bacterium]
MKPFRIGTFSRIDVNLHWSFFFLLGGIFVFYLYQGASVLAALAGVAMMGAAFVCVVLHEYGHALMARHYNIPTLDITLYPIGGVARLSRLPREPFQEFMIAIAGPAVNLGIGGALYVLLSLFGGAPSLPSVLAAPTQVLGALMWFNFSMAAFNMLPAFPMDGGRVLRAGLATSFEYGRATQMAAFVGHVVALGMFVFGLFTGQFMLPLIAVFIVLAAQQEVQQSVTR